MSGGTGPSTRERAMRLLLLAFAILLLLPLYSKFMETRAKGQLTECRSNLKNLLTGLEMYSTDHGGKYPTNLAALTPGYLKTSPSCPAAGYRTYRATFGPRAPYNSQGYEDYFYLECTGTAHRAAGCQPDFPALNNISAYHERTP